MSSYGVKQAQGAHVWYKLTANVCSLMTRLAVLAVGRPGGPPPRVSPPNDPDRHPPNMSASQAVAASTAARYLLR